MLQKMYTMKGLITYRNPLWNSLIAFIDDLRNSKNLQVMESGKYSNSISQIYDKAVLKCRIDANDLSIISRALNFLGERDISPELVEYMNENTSLGYRCVTTDDGEKIVREAEVIVKERNQANEIKRIYEEKKKKFEEAAARKEQYMEEQNSIIDECDNAREEFELMEEKIKTLKNFTDETKVEDEKEEVKINE